MTKLEAVNRMLREVDEWPVAALDTGGTSAAARAEALLDEKAAEIQAEGWRVNTETNGVEGVELEPDASDEIVLDADVLDADSYGVDAWRNVTVRGGKLYDIDNDTTEFSAAIRVSLVRELDFTALDRLLAALVVAEAAVALQRQLIGSRERRDELMAAAQQARIEAVSADARRDNRTLLHTPTGRSVQGVRWAPEATR